MKLSASFLSSDYNLKETLLRLNNSEVDLIHVDIMDGKFVPNCTNNVEILQEISKIEKPLDVHLMVRNPLNYIEVFRRLNPKIITIHSEIGEDISSYIKLIKSYGIKAGIAINPETKVESIIKYLNIVDMVLVMAVSPGMGGQQFRPTSLIKVAQIKQIAPDIIVSIDGGINDKFIKYIECDIVVSGSYICKSEDFNERIKKLKESKL